MSLLTASCLSIIHSKIVPAASGGEHGAPALAPQNSATACDPRLDAKVWPAIVRAVIRYHQPVHNLTLSIIEQPTTGGLANKVTSHYYDTIVKAGEIASLAEKDKPTIISLCSKELHPNHIPRCQISMMHGPIQAQCDGEEGSLVVDGCRLELSFCLDTGAWSIGEGMTEVMSYITFVARLTIFASPTEAAKFLASILWPCVKRTIEVWHPHEEGLDIRHGLNDFLQQIESHPVFGETTSILQSRLSSPLDAFLAQRAKKMFA